LEKRELNKKVGENRIRRNDRVEFKRLGLEKVTIVKKKKAFADMVFSYVSELGF
jgi:hypothetical protein